MSDQDKISPYSISTISSTLVMRMKKISIRELLVDSMLNFQTNIMRIVWQTVRRISNEILEVKD